MINNILITNKAFGFRYEILLLFSFLEVLLYDRLPIVQIVVTLSEYLFIAIYLFIDKRVSLMYFISFSLLSIGSWSYIIQEKLPNNFWGIRFGMFSLNIIFAVFIFLFIFLSSNIKSNFKSLFGITFFDKFIVYSSIIGAVYVLIGVNYFDNYLRDLMTFLPYFIYIFFLNKLENQEIKNVIKYGLSVTIISMLLSYFSNQLFNYGDGFYFILMNGFSFIALISVFLVRSVFSKWHFYFLFLSILFLISTGKVFIGGKSIIIFAFLLLWYVVSSKNVFIYLIISVFLFFVYPLLASFLTIINDEFVISYKFLQIISIFNYIDLETLASSRTSMGNIIAEGYTLWNYMISNFLILFFGKGFGAGVPDLFGYLSPLALPGAGYNAIDAVRNNFVRLHFPIYEIALKSGVLGLYFYIRMVIFSFKSKNIYDFIFFILLMTVFTNSKEMILLSLMFYKLKRYNSSLPRDYQLNLK